MNNLTVKIMKTKVLNLFAIAMICIAGFTSCSKDDDNNGDDGNFYFTAKIDGNDFSADMSNPTFTSIHKYHAESISISAMKDAANPGAGGFLININSGYSGTGTYTVGVGGEEENYARYMTGSMATSNLNSWAAETGNGSSANNVGTGTITITADANNIVEGTFSFEGYNNADQTTKQITAGKFRMKVIN